MRSKIVWVLVAVISCVFLSSCQESMQSKGPNPLGGPSVNGFITSSGKDFVGADGQKVILKGINLGSWLNQEMWMMDVKDPDIPDQYTFEKVLKDRFGESERQRLMDLYRANWITERDYKIVKSFGFNMIRLPFHYNIIENDARPMTLRKDAWKWLDHAIALAEKYDMYVVLDLHSAVGCQSDFDHSGRKNWNKFWDDKKYWKRTAWVWEQIAKRYKDNEIIAMYQPINEPWGGTFEQQVEVFDDIYHAIRKHDTKHLVSPSAHWSGFGHYGDPKDHGWDGIVMSQNFYPGLFGGGPAIPEGHRAFLENLEPNIQSQIDKLNVPFMVTEFNVVFNKAGGGEMMRRHYDRYEELGWAATAWSYKVLTSPGMSNTGGWWFVTQYGGKSTGRWWAVTNKNPRMKIDLNTSSKEDIEAYIKELGTMELRINEEFRNAMVKKESPAKILPKGQLPPLGKAPAQEKLGDWTATDIAPEGTEIWEGGEVVVGDDGLDIYAGGNDVWGTADSFRFVWKKVKGDFEFEILVKSMEFTEVYAKTGIMIRNSLDADSSTVFMAPIGDGTVEIAWRLKDGAEMADKMIMGTDFPVRLKMVRKGDIIERYFAAETGDWFVYDSIDYPELGDEAYVGMFACSHNVGRLTKTEHRDIKLKVK